MATKATVDGEIRVEAPVADDRKTGESLVKAGSKGVKAEGKKVEVAAPANDARLSPDLVAVAQAIPRHELAHGDASGAASGMTIAAAGRPHTATLGSADSTVKSAEVVVAKPVVEVGAHATDLKTLTATPNVLEVGVASGSHGWLRVRAELGPAGEVVASVGAASAGAAEGLHKELPAISAYLAEERVGVGSLVVHAIERGSGAQDSTLNAGTGGAAGSQPGTGQRGRDLSFPMTAVQGADSDAGGVLEAMSQPWIVGGNGSGGWVSVRV